MIRISDRRNGERGLSIVELLIAAALMLFIILGVLPLFTMAIKSNLEGSESTNVAAFARESLEALWQLPIDSPELAVTAGTSRVTDQYYSEKDGVWKTGVPPSDGTDPATWTRQITVEQFTVEELAKAEEEDRAPVPLGAGTPTGDIQVKRLTVAVTQLGQPGFLGSGKRITVQALKAQ